MNNVRVWISGSNGRVGQALSEYLNPLAETIILTDIDTVDVTNAEETVLFASRIRPNVIINCSGYTNPAECEDNPDKAYAVNGLGARNMAIAASHVDAKLIHLSTDEVFDGGSDEPYREYVDPEPKTVYGQSKLFGEQLVRQFNSRYFIIRMSYLYSPVNRRVERIVEAAKNNEPIYVAKDYYGSPTSVYELAKFIIYLMRSYEFGTYHATCEGVATYAEFAKEVLNLTGLEGEVIEDETISSTNFRPQYTALDNYMLHLSKLYKFPAWKTALKDYLREHGYPLKGEAK